MEGFAQNRLAMILPCILLNSKIQSLILSVSHTREAFWCTTNHLYDISSPDTKRINKIFLQILAFT